MGTSSTKSNKRKRGERQAARAVSAPPSNAEVSERVWRTSVVVIVALAAFLRFYNLNLVPFHHDEGVNGNFLVRLVREGFYHYDPANYHGPTLYYFAAAFPWVLRGLFGVHAQNTYGLTNIAVRAIPALFGIATILLIFMLRRNIGTIATISAAFLLAVSPGAVYLSRYFIHETLFVFFTVAIVVASIKFYETARAHYLLWGSVSAAMMFATKETAMISASVLLIALLLTFTYRRFFAPRTPAGSGKDKRKNDDEAKVAFIERIGGSTNLIIWIAAGIVLFVSVHILFYSSFFTNYPQGVYDSLKTFAIWQKTGKTAHVHPFITYVWWLFLQESPVLFFGSAGALLALSRSARTFALFTALWAFGLLAAYSLIAYKTPWLCLSFLVPLAISAGYFVQWVYEQLPASRSRLGAMIVLVVVATGILPGVARAWDHQQLHWKTFIPGYQMIDLNFINYDNDDRYYVYVYAHTRREMLKLVDEIDRLAQRTHQGQAAGITIVSRDYWPLPWYLRDYSRVGYYGQITPSKEPMILASSDQAEEVQATYGERYQQVPSGLNPQGSFPLRPGVDLLLYARRELLP